MRRPTALAVLLAFTLLASSLSARAHHSIAHDFDVFHTVRLQGTVARMSWANPHIGLEVAVRNADGSASTWQVEGGPPNALTRRGWTRSSLAAGSAVTIEAWPARDGSHRANAREVLLPDGRRLDAASSYHPPAR
jgi:hypothetical protein